MTDPSHNNSPTAATFESLADPAMLSNEQMGYFSFVRTLEAEMRESTLSGEQVKAAKA